MGSCVLSLGKTCPDGWMKSVSLPPGGFWSWGLQGRLISGRAPSSMRVRQGEGVRWVGVASVRGGMMAGGIDD